MPQDLYTELLGIPPGPRPPNHYTILGLPVFEADAHVIHEAVLHQTAELKRYVLHRDPDRIRRVQEMLNEVHGAGAVLQDPEAKGLYDEKLAQLLGIVLPPRAAAVGQKLPQAAQAAPQQPELELELVPEPPRPSVGPPPAEAEPELELVPPLRRPSAGPGPPEPEPQGGAHTLRNVLLLAGVAAAALVATLVASSFSRNTPPDSAAPTDKVRQRSRTPPIAADSAAAQARNEVARIRVLAGRGQFGGKALIEQADAFLQRYGGSQEAEEVKKLRDQAVAAQREVEADREFRAIEPGYYSSSNANAQRINGLDSLVKKYPGTRAAARAAEQLERLVERRDGDAERAASSAKYDLDRLLKAEAYGPALALLDKLAKTYEGTKAATDAAAQAAGLRQKLAGEFKEKRAAAEQCLLRAAFRDAAAALDAPLKVWQCEDLRREAADFVASVEQRRGAIIQAYGTFLNEAAPLAEAWKLDEARAAATKAAGRADDPVLRALLDAQAAQFALLLRVRDRVVAGAKAAQGKGKVLLRRPSGMGLPAAISNVSETGLVATMPGFKGPLGWGDLHVDQLLLFARTAPGKLTAEDLTAFGLVSLRLGDIAAAFKAFDEAATLDPAALDTVAGLLRHHAQGFVLVPGGQFPAGPKNEPATLDAFLLARAEVTNAEFAFYARVTKAELPSDWRAGADDHPVAKITWAQADAYARWLDMRLPTDLEWERAVRGTDGRLYPWGDQFDRSLANLGRAGDYGVTTPGKLMPAYRAPRRAEGPFFHLVGNVREMTAGLILDWNRHPIACRTVGGSAADRESKALATARQERGLDARDPFTGFRLAWPR